MTSAPVRTHTVIELQQRLVDSLPGQSPATVDTLLEDEPLIRFVNQLIAEAILRNASDIHIEPFPDLCRIRYRELGVLRVATELPSVLAGRMAARLKVMAGLDIAEKRLPQDGRFQFQGTDIRISTCPVLVGEKCVLRLLKSPHALPEMAHTGMSATQQTLYSRALSQPQGMILVTGPTGSGKTVTLYAGLNHINRPEKNISTVEDPVEIRFPGINQVNVNPRAGLHFATVLRALLRQDPDVIMVGEIRDAETAHIATQAAQTGHLVLSTLHAGKADEALTRMTAMGVPASLVQSSVRLVIAQRLFRVLCKHCKIPIVPDRNLFPEIIHAGKRRIYAPGGCEHCTEGFSGRTAIFECLPVTPAGEDSPLSLRKSAVGKVFSGETSSCELIRVLES